MKPWYFEGDCLFCTQSASSFCRHPLYFLAHSMWVKWWYHANFQPFQSSFCSAFQFHGHLALKKSVNGWKIANDARKGWKLMTWIWIVHLYPKKVRSCNKVLKYWIAGVTDEFSSETLILRKRLSSLYTHPVFAVTISTFLHMPWGCNEDTMPSFNLFRVHW